MGRIRRVQDTLLKAWAARDSYQPGSQLRAWLFTILRNTFYSDLRKSHREVEDVDGIRAQALCEEPRQEDSLALKELMSVIARLPDAQRRPLIMMGAFGFSQLEAADACSCTVGTIKSRVSRSRATLNRLLAHDELKPDARQPRAGPVPRPTEQSRTGTDADLMVAHARSN